MKQNCPVCGRYMKRYNYYFGNVLIEQIRQCKDCNVTIRWKCGNYSWSVGFVHNACGFDHYGSRFVRTVSLATDKRKSQKKYKENNIRRIKKARKEFFEECEKRKNRRIS